jgi:hypothetical protein
MLFCLEIKFEKYSRNEKKHLTNTKTGYIMIKNQQERELVS